jgi:hypothetical protein
MSTITFGGHMHGHRFLAIAVTVFAVTACNPFHHQRAVEVSTGDVNLNSRWHASLASPADLAGAVQMNGSAAMAPGTKGGNTSISLNIANASPGGVHPWAVHRGQCSADDGTFGPPSAYRPVTIDGDGRGSAVATIPFETPTTGMYFVSVRASAANGETVVACGNLAPPSR